jgi:hypothetical protein
VQTHAWAGSFHQTREGGRSGAEEMLEVVQALPVQSKSFKLVSDVALQKYVDENIKQLETLLPTLQSPEKKLSLIHDRINRISAYRSTHWSKSAFVELQMDSQIKPFESFPQAEQFNKNRCEQYKNTVLVEWEPTAADRKATQPGVARALRILKDICS